jgi:UDP-N-acetylmuramyl pentapeptide phosphotransferase/UDP-N-acetylglucosamine-1-phosphate transferase
VTTLAAGAVGAGIARAVQRQLNANPPGGRQRWERINYRGRTVTLAAGPAMALGAAAGAALAPGTSTRMRAAGAVVAGTAGVVGLYDDLAGSSASKGLGGHLTALRHGQVTSGAVKIAVLGAAGLAGAALVIDDRLDVLVGGAAVAGHANLLNLLDLRPGRAIKVALLHSPVVLRGPAAGLAAAGVGAATAMLPADLGEESMLGDAGANALGAALGLAMVAREGRTARLVHLGVVTALTLASERVSFTRVIEETPVLRELDRLGRRPQDDAIRR